MFIRSVLRQPADLLEWTRTGSDIISPITRPFCCLASSQGASQRRSGAGWDAVSLSYRFFLSRYDTRSRRFLPVMGHRRGRPVLPLLFSRPDFPLAPRHCYTLDLRLVPPSEKARWCQELFTRDAAYYGLSRLRHDNPLPMQFVAELRPAPVLRQAGEFGVRGRVP